MLSILLGLFLDNFYILRIIKSEILLATVIKITCSSSDLAKEIKDLFPLSRIYTKEPHIVQFTSVKAAHLEEYPLRIKQDIQVWFKSIIKLMEAGQHRSTDATVISNIKNLIKNRPE